MAVQASTVSSSSPSGPLLAGDWRWWPHVVLRAPGFPAVGILDLKATACAKAADSLIGSGAATEGDAVEAWRDYRSLFAAAIHDQTTRLREIARNPRFKEAVLWQNRQAWRTGIELMLEWRPGIDHRNARHRAREELVAMYWQRYCVKNDSIGFSGPIGWARLTDDPMTLLVRTDGPLFTDFTVHFENWPIDALARLIASLPAVKPWLPPVRMPYVQLEEAAADVCLPNGQRLTLSALALEVLRACDGRRGANQVVDAVLARTRQPGDDRLGGPLDAAAVYAVLGDLEQRRVIAWTLSIPVSLRPEEALRAAIERIGDAPLREHWSRQLERLQAARRQVAAAAGDPDALDPLLEQLEDTFRDLTQQAALRNPGKTYGARTLVFADARRGTDLELGAGFAAALQPLSLLLDSGRWFTQTLAHLLRDRLLQHYRTLASRQAGGPGVSLATFWFSCMPIVHGELAGLLTAVEDDFHARWSRILRVPLSRREVRYRTAEIAPAVQAAFPAHRGGWAGARWFSPDVMIAAQSADAIQRDDYFLVLGEIHAAINALRHLCLINKHPSPGDLLRQLELDVPQPRLLPVLPKDGPARLTPRVHPGLIREKDFQVALFHQTADPARERLLLSGDLRVEERDGQLVVHSRRHDAAFDVLDPFAELLMVGVLGRITLFGVEPHTPRVWFDRMVVSRETWNVPAASVPFGRERDEAVSFLQARRWRTQLGLPTQAFVKSPLEDKPFYVDFDSPVYVSLLGKSIRRMLRQPPAGVAFRVSEMLPTTGQLWLVDAGDLRYTSELRLTAFDLRQ